MLTPESATCSMNLRISRLNLRNLSNFQRCLLEETKNSVPPITYRMVQSCVSACLCSVFFQSVLQCIVLKCMHMIMKYLFWRVLWFKRFILRSNINHWLMLPWQDFKIKICTMLKSYICDTFSISSQTLADRSSLVLPLINQVRTHDK